MRLERDGEDGLLWCKLQEGEDDEMLFQKTVCVQHTQTYKVTHTHTLSLKRNEDEGLWRPWLAHTCTLTKRNRK